MPKQLCIFIAVYVTNLCDGEAVLVLRGIVPPAFLDTTLVWNQMCIFIAQLLRRVTVRRGLGDDRPDELGVCRKLDLDSSLWQHA